MNHLVTTIRVLASLQGLFLVSASTLDIAGLIPHSEAMPSLAQRAFHALPLAAVGGLSLLPYRFVRTRPLRMTLACGLCLVVAWVAYVSADGVSGYVLGKKSWHVVPFGILFSTMAIGNLWAFLRITAGGRAVLSARPTIG